VKVAPPAKYVLLVKNHKYKKGGKGYSRKGFRSQLKDYSLRTACLRRREEQVKNQGSFTWGRGRGRPTKVHQKTIKDQGRKKSLRSSGGKRKRNLLRSRRSISTIGESCGSSRRNTVEGGGGREEEKSEKGENFHRKALSLGSLIGRPFFL